MYVVCFIDRNPIMWLRTQDCSEITGWVGTEKESRASPRLTGARGSQGPEAARGQVDKLGLQGSVEED